VAKGGSPASVKKSEEKSQSYDRSLFEACRWPDGVVKCLVNEPGGGGGWAEGFSNCPVSELNWRRMIPPDWRPPPASASPFAKAARSLALLCCIRWQTLANACKSFIFFTDPFFPRQFELLSSSPDQRLSVTSQTRNLPVICARLKANVPPPTKS
jgi:hypothetical protein